MVFIGRKKYRLGLMVVTLMISIITIVEILSKFQLHQEIKHYRAVFKNSKNPGFYDPLNIKQIPYATIQTMYTENLDQENSKSLTIEWEKFAYVNYVATEDYLCNSMVMFKKLLSSGTKAKLLLLITSDLLENKDSELKVDKKLSELKAFSPEQIIIKKIETINKHKDYTPWSTSLSKLLIFNETSYERIIYMDNDALIRGENTNFDELFFLPTYIDFAAPLTYWNLNEKKISQCYKDVSKVHKWSNRLDKYIDESYLSIKRHDNYDLYNGLPNLPPSLYLSNNDAIASEVFESSAILSLSSLINFFKLKNSNQVKFASDFMVIKPSEKLFEEIYYNHIPRNLNKKQKYDMDIISDDLFDFKKIIYYQFKLFKKLRKMFIPNVLVLPAREYGLLSGSLKNPVHYDIIRNDCIGYYDSEYKDFDSYSKKHKIIDSINKWNKYTHFSDFPLNKPWAYSETAIPECKINNNEQDNDGVCSIWHNDYAAFLGDYKKICL